jgi:hypothetical protein
MTDGEYSFSIDLILVQSEADFAVGSEADSAVGLFEFGLGVGRAF